MFRRKPVFRRTAGSGQFSIRFMATKKKTKMDLVDCIYAKTSCRLSAVKSIVDLFLDEMRTALEAGTTIELRGFGTFELRERKGRTHARNPRTGETVSVGRHSVVVFRAGRDLKNAVWKIPAETADE